MNTLYIVLPAYNEEKNIEDVVSQWYQNLSVAGEDSRIVVADAGSTDRTHEILVNMQKKMPKLVILENTMKQHGPKLIALYNYAISQNADFVFQTDSDGQTNPSEFIEFWNCRGFFDAVIGHRAIRGDGKARENVEKVVCLLLKMYFGVKVPDANAPFRLIKCDVLKQYMSEFRSDYNLPNIMITTFLMYYRHSVKFEKITFKPRQAGANSINLKKIVVIGVKALKDFQEFKKKMN